MRIQITQVRWPLDPHYPHVAMISPRMIHQQCYQEKRIWPRRVAVVSPRPKDCDEGNHSPMLCFRFTYLCIYMYCYDRKETRHSYTFLLSLYVTIISVSSWLCVRCAPKTTCRCAIWSGFRPATMQIQGHEKPSLGSDLGTTSKETRNMYEHVL